MSIFKHNMASEKKLPCIKEVGSQEILGDLANPQA